MSTGQDCLNYIPSFNAAAQSRRDEAIDAIAPRATEKIAFGATAKREAAICEQAAIEKAREASVCHPTRAQTYRDALPVDVLRLDFDRRLMLQCRGSVVTSDPSLLAYRELEGAFGLTVMAGELLADARTGNNGVSRIARDVHINGNAVAPMRAAIAIMSGSLCLK
jgi:hypothetical protein